MKICPTCGTKLDEDDIFCPECGARVDKKLKTPFEKQRMKKISNFLKGFIIFFLFILIVFILLAFVGTMIARR